MSEASKLPIWSNLRHFGMMIRPWNGNAGAFLFLIKILTILQLPHFVAGFLWEKKIEFLNFRSRPIARLNRFLSLNSIWIRKGMDSKKVIGIAIRYPLQALHSITHGRTSVENMMQWEELLAIIISTIWVCYRSLINIHTEADYTIECDRPPKCSNVQNCFFRFRLSEETFRGFVLTP